MPEFRLTSPKVDRGAVLSEDRRYRYRLWRLWDDTPALLWVMLNPSVADADFDDPTIRKCIGFARRWGYGGIQVVNLFAWRATKPDELNYAHDPIGPNNDVHISQAVRMCPDKIIAWGARLPSRFPDRASEVLGVLGNNVSCLRRSATGMPHHPLYIPYNQKAIALT